jgi:hypothetical protein
MSDPSYDPADDTSEVGQSAGLPLVDSQVRPCRHLRSNGMYLYTDGAKRESLEQYSSSVCWCHKTMNGFGPDDDMVGWLDCRNTSRSCYTPLY